MKHYIYEKQFRENELRRKLMNTELIARESVTRILETEAETELPFHKPHRYCKLVLNIYSTDDRHYLRYFLVNFRTALGKNEFFRGTFSPLS